MRGVELVDAPRHSLGIAPSSRRIRLVTLSNIQFSPNPASPHGETMELNGLSFHHIISDDNVRHYGFLHPPWYIELCNSAMVHDAAHVIKC
jgi:hypothetical protein